MRGDFKMKLYTNINLSKFFLTFQNIKILIVILYKTSLYL